MYLSKLDGLTTEAARATPDENHVPFLQNVAFPTKQHTVRCRAYQRGRSSFLPTQVRRLGQYLVRLGHAELTKGTKVGVVPPYLGRWRQHGVFASLNPRVVKVPIAVMDDHLIADGNVLNGIPNRVHNPRHVTATNMKVIRLAHLLAHADHINRGTASRPNIIVVDASRHDADQYLIGFDFRDVNLLHLKRRARITKTFLAYYLRQHLLRNFTDWWQGTNRNCARHP